MHSNWLINSRVTVQVQYLLINSLVTVCTVTSPCIWARFGPAHVFGPDSAHFKEKNKKYLFQYFIIFPRSFYVILINIGWYLMLLKIQNLILKYPVFVKNFQKYKTIKKKRKKMFLCIRPSVSKLKEIILYFSYTKKTMF